jgi:thioredoxin-dependent peroxiredoxin
MAERVGEAFAQNKRLTVIGQKLQSGASAPDFTLDYVDLIDMIVFSTHLADSAGMVRVLSIVNSLDNAICRKQTLHWETLRLSSLPADVCLYTISMDLPYLHLDWQVSKAIIHQTLSAHRNEQFGQDYGILLKEWHLLQRAIFIIDRNNHIAYAEYVADQYCEPDYNAALRAIEKLQLYNV